MGDFKGSNMHFGEVDRKETAKKLRAKHGIVEHAQYWQNRRPICPYGCGEEGTLLEIIVKDGKALGIYTHSESVKPFTADLQVSPKPTGGKIVIGADGEPKLVEDV